MHPVRVGFTLVEVLIIVVILGIVAMVVIPRVGTATSDARENSLQTDLFSLRNQVEMYKAQHNGQPPHLDENGTADTANMVARMTGKTDSSGKINASGTLGPYVFEWPANPFISGSAAKAVVFGTAYNPPRDNTAGWYYCTDTNIISADSTTGAINMDPPAAPSSGTVKTTGVRVAL